jgi:GTP cyclohydrolase I
MTNYLRAEESARVMLGHLGIECTDELDETPGRLVRALAELTSSLRDGFDPAHVLSRQFAAPADVPQMITVTGLAFTSLCEHHVLPFTGTATVAYLPQPGAKVVGVSKIARLVNGLAARPQMQERLGYQITAQLGKHLDIEGAGVVLRGVHSCMTMRGPCATGAEMITSHFTGCFLDAPVRGEFLALTRP